MAAGKGKRAFPFGLRDCPPALAAPECPGRLPCGEACGRSSSQVNASGGLKGKLLAAR
jgi:hypothetical protein